MGLLVSDVNSSLSAGKAGVLHGDVLIAIDGETIVAWKQVIAILRKHSASDEVVLTVQRKSKGRLDMPTVLDEVPEVKPCPPGKNKFIRSMSDGLMAGLLVREDRMSLPGVLPDHVMIVDKRTVKPGEPEPAERNVFVEFASEVTGVSVFTRDAKEILTPGRRITLKLEPGAGLLLAVHS